ncbi:MAG: RimK domain-containing protein ATP-grasp [Deltaproteobacteria bacterium]|nr:MAG: RimK domain-containing protein ATP-grasp [Deltaproteobacteria bacterium]TMQ25826.1 MAG: RimK domain-containing protein ATP-grasp [Deltaproteobacteria bacterium]
MILLWGLPGDDPLDAVVRELGRRGTPFELLDQRHVLDQRVELDIAPTVGGAVWSGEHRIVLDEVSAVYTRVYNARDLAPVAGAGDAALARVEQVETALWAWVEDTAARVVNPPSAMSSNSSKPYQATRIAACGFRVPASLITTDADAALAFWERHGEVIYKSVSGVRSMVSRLGRTHRDRLADVAWCPTQFQEWVPGRDHRVHVVGAEVFAVEIVSDADDYRYAQRQGTTAELRTTRLPPDIAERAVATAEALRLPVAGLDLRRTPAGEWFCFEVNPSPCFTYYEHHTAQPITAAVASLLAGHQ